MLWRKLLDLESQIWGTQDEQCWVWQCIAFCVKIRAEGSRKKNLVYSSGNRTKEFSWNCFVQSQSRIQSFIFKTQAGIIIILYRASLFHFLVIHFKMFQSEFWSFIDDTVTLYFNGLLNETENFPHTWREIMFCSIQERDPLMYPRKAFSMGRFRLIPIYTV